MKELIYQSFCTPSAHILHVAPTNGIRGYKNVDAQAASRRVVRLRGLT
ncbi:hypothetical protein H6G74_04085 [Nostoc spongiaeforme FACHB-130]|uniref:Uncharacterized protein n=1 Tax=Nostoc spongiaeforme FACHB-130 TaxID=1357510 RepID=A0ABR8FR23_9NOSO|nr:hypothetical protein [Nostoc spongiaeforme]MBD2593508.1 hypothetical protein [Nostoc spongiaeforme FACHB-130]